jgi:hypothetical protein
VRIRADLKAVPVDGFARASRCDGAVMEHRIDADLIAVAPHVDTSRATHRHASKQRQFVPAKGICGISKRQHFGAIQ